MNAMIEQQAITRPAPASFEAETAIIGALLLDNSVLDRMSDKLKPEHFSRHDLREIFAECVKQIGKGQQCDIVTVFSAMHGKADLEFLTQLAQYVPSASNIRRYSEIVIERSKSRSLLLVSGEIDALAHDHAQSIDDRVDAAQAQLAKLIDDAPRDEFIGAFEAMTMHTEVLDRRAAGDLVVWPTGLADLDDLMEGGLRPGELVIIGARPSMGKTALGMTIGMSMAETHSVAMLSMEMPHTEVRDRMTAMLGNVSLSSVKRPDRGDGLAWDRVLDGVEKARRIKFFVSDQGGLTINQVRSKARNVKRLHGLNVLVLDYLGLMNGTDQRQPRAYQLEEVTKGLKELAKELQISILCLAQVNRKVEERADAMPVLSDLRDSGSIEQDADTVIFVHRPAQAKQDLGSEWTNYAKVSVAKNRNARCGVFNLFYVGDQTKFTGWSGPAPAKASFSGKGGL